MVDQFNHHLYRKRGFYYFSRRVPKTLLDHYQKSRIVIALRTRHFRKALAQSQMLAKRLDDQWFELRLTQLGLGSSARHLEDINGKQPEGPRFSEAVEFYLQLKAHDKDEVFTRTAKRNRDSLISVLGDKPVDQYTSKDAGKLRDALLERGLSVSSVRRNFATIRSIVNLSFAEHGLEGSNAFAKVVLPTARPTARQPIPLDAIKEIQAECKKIDDQARWLVALISDTGLRLSEATGILVSDIVLDNPYPHVIIQPHPWRRLKTESSERLVPLVGAALWAARRVKDNAQHFAFDKYCSGSGTKSNSASAALNKWLKPRVPKGCVIHSFRHSFRDRLRAVECPLEITDQLGGWSSQTIGQSYGKGYGLDVLSKWLSKMDLADRIT